MSNTNRNFETLEELSELLEELGLKLHGKNRMGGESEYLWQLAETLRKAALLAELYNKKPELNDMFGNGYTKGTIEEGLREQEFLTLLKKQETD